MPDSGVLDEIGNAVDSVERLAEKARSAAEGAQAFGDSLAQLGDSLKKGVNAQAVPLGPALIELFEGAVGEWVIQKGLDSAVEKGKEAFGGGEEKEKAAEKALQAEEARQQKQAAKDEVFSRAEEQNRAEALALRLERELHYSRERAQVEAADRVIRERRGQIELQIEDADEAIVKAQKSYEYHVKTGADYWARESLNDKKVAEERRKLLEAKLADTKREQAIADERVDIARDRDKSPPHQKSAAKPKAAAPEEHAGGPSALILQQEIVIQLQVADDTARIHQKKEEEKRHQDAIKKLIGDSAKEAADAQLQAKVAEDALALMREKGVSAAVAKRMAEEANTDAVLKNAKAVIEAAGADEKQTAEYMKNVQAKIDANKKLADMSQQQHAIENTQKQMQGLLGEMNNFGKALTYVFGAMEQDENGAARIKKGMEAAAIAAKALGQAMEFGFGLAKTSISQAMDKALLFSHAQEQLAALSKASAAQKKAEQEAQTQAFLADVAKRATIMALEETAMGIGAAATYQFPSAAAHFVAAGLFGLIAGGTAIGASVIGNTRGNTYAEDEAIKAASKRDTDTNSSGLTSSGDTGSGSDGESSKRPLVINVTAGGGLLATATDLDRAIQKAAAYAARVS